LPRARDAALGKVAFAVRYCADRPLPRATLGKAFAEDKGFFAERIRPSAKNLVPVVFEGASGRTARNNTLPDALVSL